MDIEDILKGLSDAASEGGPMPTRKHTHRSPEQKVKLLLHSWARLREPCTLQEGDIVRGKKELSSDTMRSWSEPHIIVKLLDKPVTLSFDDDGIASAVMAKSYDCLIGNIIPTENGQMLTFLFDRQELEPYPGALEILTKLQSS